MQKILCVEDSSVTAQLLKTLLSGYDVTIAKSLQEARASLAKDKFSLLLLDIELPDGTGFELMAELGDNVRFTPVIFLTGRLDFASKASAFALGADDFIVKPFDPKDVRLRIDSKLRKMAVLEQRDQILTIGNLVCNVQEQRLHKKDGGQSIDLTSLEFRIFRLLATAPNKIFTRPEILERVWGQTISVTERAVDVHISNLRKKLEGTGVNIDAIVGTGYRIIST